jgi:hypothetical protein
MKVYFNGCSHTYGDDLQFPETDAWPAVLARQKEYDFVNFSISGNTNDNIKYQTIKHADNFDKFYIAWTYTSRFTRYRSDNNHSVNFNPMLKHSLYGKDYEFTEYGKLHYRTWHNELFAFKIWLQDIILVQRFLESKNKPYLMINTDNNAIKQWTTDWPKFNNSVKSLLCFDKMDDSQLFSEHREIQQLLSQINFSNYIEFDTWWLTIMSSKYPIGPTRHLLEDGHRATAEYILKYD